MVKEKNWREKILAYALKNAVEHDGKAVEGAVISALFHEGLKKEEVKNVISDVKKIISEVNSLSLQEQEEKFKSLESEVSRREIREGLPELPNVKEKVVLRLAPYPSGALHIGNARTYVLNALYAEKYRGKLYFFIDDTIGSEKKQIIKEAYKIIPEEFDWLKIKYEKPIIYKSDRLKIYYEHAEKLIKKDKAYVCSCNAETLRKNRAEGKECSCRKQTIKENLELWKKMFDKKTSEGAYTLRIRTSMKDKNPAFRDRVLFRISERAHPRVGKKYKVWPLLDFSWAIDDHLFGITHIIRGKDLMMESEMENYIWKIFGWKAPEILHNGLVRIEGVAKISKSKAQQEVKSGKFSGWHDPRTWSISSLKKRGFLPEIIREFIEGMGLNQNDIIVPVEVLYALNRKLLHDIARQAKFEKGKGNVKVIMPDGKVIKGSSDIKVRKDEIVHFVGFGYTKFDGNKFYFAHK